MLVNPDDIADLAGHALEEPAVVTMVRPQPVAGYAGKRLFDLLIAAALVLAFLPAMILIACAIKVGSPGPVFFRQERLGAHGRPFHLLKFRTMVIDAEARLQAVLSTSPELRAEYAVFHKLARDPRVTPIGRFLRKTSLDELPQLFNVLWGDMSVVGPRPYLPRERAKIGPALADILRAKPGITGPWQVGGRNRTTFAQRVEIERRYADTCGPLGDARLLMGTVGAVLKVGETS